MKLKENFMIAQRFVIYQDTMVLLTDYTFWNEHYEELKEWCNLNYIDLSGMLVNLKTVNNRDFFILKWS